MPATLARPTALEAPAGPPGLPPRLTPELLHSLAGGATLAGGRHEVHHVVAPFSGRHIAEVCMGGPEDVRLAVRRARAAQPAWAARSVRQRAAVLMRLHDLVMQRMHETMDLLQLEGGKSRLDAFIETMDVALVARYYGAHGPRALAGGRRRGFLPLLTQTRVGYHPKGVVGVIAPWNYPFTMAISDALPALLAGNSVVIKPAEFTPLIALWAARLCYEAGLPAEVLHVVPGHGSEIGPVLIDEADFVQFTGSTEVGRIVAERAGQSLTGVSLELGGKNPLIVREDADLQRAIPGILQACFSCAGQLCISAERLYVHQARYDEFVAALEQAVGRMVVNDRYDFSAHMGSLLSQEQLDKVSAHVDEARQRGATVIAGGRALPELGPFFYAPTVLAGVTEEMAVFREETFGPVAAVYPVASDDEAVALANDSDYGLHASVWTRDPAGGLALAQRLQCGTVSVNDAYVSAWGSTGTPMGGFKQSGLGRRHGPEGLLKFTEPQTVALQLLGPLAPESFSLTRDQFADVTARGLSLLRRLPGLR
jgi:succinate-semialdehyde dehydrogenase / glutarate-semialdehyde dehydrogenase